MYEQKGKIIAVTYVLFVNWLYLVKKNSVKKMEIIYYNCFNLINAWNLYQIFEGRRNYFYSTIQKNFNKLCFKLRSLCNNLYEKKEIERTFFFQKLRNSKLRTLLYWVTWPEWDLKFLLENRILVSQLKFILFFIYLLHDIYRI